MKEVKNNSGYFLYVSKHEAEVLFANDIEVYRLDDDFTDMLIESREDFDATPEWQFGIEYQS